MPDRNAAIEEFTEMVNGFADRFDAAWHDVLRAKLGLAEARDADMQLAFDLLERMARGGADFTNTFRALSGPAPETAADQFSKPDALKPWLEQWRARLDAEGRDEAQRIEAMQSANPALIPRNHRIEEAIAAAVSGDLAPFHRLNRALATPHAPDPDDMDLATPPRPDERVTQTFCGT
jgi:uncharacterized protein YdiU (UPF0061 family)